MTVWWVIEKMKRILREQGVSIENYFLWGGGLFKFAKPCDMTLQLVAWFKFEPGTSQKQVGNVAASVNFSHLTIIL